MRCPFRSIAVAGALAAAAVAPTCGGERSALEPIPDPTAPLQTDSLRMRWESAGGLYLRAAVPFTFTNQASDTIYIVTCGSHVLPDLQRRDGGSWNVVHQAVAPRCLNVIPIPPGARWRDSLPVCYVLNPITSACAPWAVPGGPDGTYRLVVTGAVFHYRLPGASDTFGDSVPEAYRRSNGFVLSR